jgi:hypothetical protein
MYQAEIHGKFAPHEERKEDILTSNVFSFFKYAKREIFLYQLITRLGIVDIEPWDAINAEFHFWPSFEDGTEPDLVIIIGNYYLVFEAKLFSGFGRGIVSEKDQLVREIRGGKTEAEYRNKKFSLIAVTAHYSKHHFLTENPDALGVDLSWLNWNEIALLIYKIINETELLDDGTLCFANDLYELLLRKNLRKFAGLEVLSTLDYIGETSTYLFYNPTTSQYRGDFFGFSEVLSGLSPITQIPSSFILQERVKMFFHHQSIESLNQVPENIFFKR